MLGHTFYHGSIRKAIIAFGKVFDAVNVQRKNGTTVVQNIKVPIAYAPKEKHLVQIDQSPDVENATMITLPLMSFEVTGINYDSTRKTPKVNKVSYDPNNSTKLYQYAPVPYNVNISLYVLSKTQEDALQIVEQILPFFTPDFMVNVNMLPEMGIVQDIPLTLNSVSFQDEYDGDFQTRRYVTYTLDFTMKLNLYGPVSDGKPITKVTVDTDVDNASYNAIGDLATRTVTSEGWTQ